MRREITFLDRKSMFPRGDSRAGRMRAKAVPTGEGGAPERMRAGRKGMNKEFGQVKNFGNVEKTPIKAHDGLRYLFCKSTPSSP